MLTIFTSDHPRHYYLINRLAEIDSVCVVMQVFNREVHTKSDHPVFDEYFKRMGNVERIMFPDTKINPTEIIVTGSLDKIKTKLPLAFTADRYIVFGCGWIKGELYDQIKDRAINIHMGVGYRGASCNAFAIYEGNHDQVGATIQELSKDLDEGEPVGYAFGDYSEDTFEFSMSAVKNAVDEVVQLIDLDDFEPLYDRYPNSLMRYKRDFTPDMAYELMNNPVSYFKNEAGI